METINNLASAAAKAVWGDSEANKEPISGEKGDVSKGQPYDAGNLDLSEQDNVENKVDTGRSETGITSTSTFTSTDTNARTNNNNNNNNSTAISSTSSSTTPSTSASAPTPADTNTSNSAIPTTNVGNADSASKPSVTDSSGAQPSLSDSTAAQNDTRDPDDENAQIEPKGPGPRPLNVVAKEHGGDAGKDHETDSKATGSSSSLDESKAGADVAGDAESQGSGQQYVKTSGLAADGGDFDATKPGAGREADRLMEEKGIHHEEGKDSSHGSSSSHHGHTKDKPSLSERIKAKLHKH